MKEWLPLFVAVAAGTLGSGGTWYLLRANRRKINADADNTAVGTAQQVVALVTAQLEAQRLQIEAQTAEITALRLTVEAQAEQIAELRRHITRLEDFMRTNNIDPTTIKGDPQ